MCRVIAMATVVLLAGCDFPALDLPMVVAAKPVTYHSVSYYDANPLERGRTKAWCDDNPGLAKNTPSCGSADQSDINAFNHKMGWR